MQIAVVHPLDDRTVREFLIRLLSERNGTIPLADLKEKISRRFNISIEIYGEKEARELGFISKGLWISNGVASFVTSRESGLPN